MDGLNTTCGNDRPTILQMEAYQRPREKCLVHGVESLEMEELLAVLLRTGCKGRSALGLARDMLQQLEKSALDLNKASLGDFLKVKGIGRDKAVTICAAIELGRRLKEMAVLKEYKNFNSPQAVAAYMMERMRHLREEHFMVLYLNSKNKLIGLEEMSKGTLNSSAADQRSVFRGAIEHNAAAIILVHNHPSGDPEPSPQDIEVTRIFKEAGRLMGIPILDHVIIGDRSYFSLCENGKIT